VRTGLSRVDRSESMAVMQGPSATPSRARVLALRRRVALSFPLAFLIHDLEELLGAPRWQRSGSLRLRRRFPDLPARVLELVIPNTGQMAIAIGVVGTGVATTSALSLVELATARRAAGASDGHRSPAAESAPLATSTPVGGEVRLLQVALGGFAVHGAGHLASAAAVRGYTPGVLTTPLVVLPYSVWAWRTLRASGLTAEPLRLARLSAEGAVLAALLVISGQLLGRRLTRH
jgi:Protein of unknown function with HXXEE motif